MATIRVTRELLEYALDLPEGVHLLEAACEWETIDGVETASFLTRGESPDLPRTGHFALQYEETETGLQLVSAVPVD
jgi:hypothetical protein